jgi:predicted amidohydrolase YtcJ
MVKDFTLRGVVLVDSRQENWPPMDATFASGRLVRLQPAAEQHPCNFYLTPGFRDAHIHMLHVGLAKTRCDLSGVTSLAESLERISEFHKSMTDPKQVLWACNWDESHWTDKTRPTLSDIDKVVDSRPVVMRRICGHQSVLNSPALHEAGLHFDMLDPGGVLNEEQSMVISGLWPPNRDELEHAYLAAESEAIGMGITRVGEMGARYALDTYLALERKDQLRLEVDLNVGPDLFDRVLELRDKGMFCGPKLHLGGIKLFTDGSIGARSAAFTEPYSDLSGSGKLLYEDEALLRHMRRCRENNLHLAIHAIGDAAVFQIISCVEKLHSESATNPNPHWLSIEHAELLPQGAIEKIADLGIVLSVQPNFVAQWAGEDGLYQNALGPEREKAMNAFRDMMDARIPLVFGSDGMPMNPALGLKGAVSHPTTASRISPTEALGVYLGDYHAPAGYWRDEPLWQLGTSRGVLYQCDPVALVGGELSAAPVAGVLSDGEWILPPAEELLHSGAIHAT